MAQTAAERKRRQREREDTTGPEPKAERQLARVSRPLPAAPADRDIPWHPQARVWWNAIAKSPQTKRWLDSDWAQLRIVLVLVDRFWRADAEGDIDMVAKLSGRINTLVGQLGGTPRARYLMGWGNQAPPSQPAPLDIDEPDPQTKETNVVDMAMFAGLHRKSS